MDCYSVFRPPDEADYMEEAVLTRVHDYLVQNSCEELLWLKKKMFSDDAQGRGKNMIPDNRIIKQAEELLKALSITFPGLYAEIGGKYGPNPSLLAAGYDDMGGYFKLILENGKVACFEDPII